LSLTLATLAVVSSALIGNRIVALLVGFWLKLPTAWLLFVLIMIDAVQIPFYYWLYSQGAKELERLPKLMHRFFHKVSQTPLARWLYTSGKWRVMLISALPAFGGGIWTATLVAYNTGLPRRSGALWVLMGSALSYLLLWSLGEGALRLMRQWTLS
jgi:uncharacterized membrane protein